MNDRDEGLPAGRDETSSNAPVVPDLLPSVDQLVERVYESFGSKKRSQISPDLIRQVIAGIDLSRPRARRRASRLRIHQLRFTGEKHLKDGRTLPIDYSQTFAPGINVVLIPDNDVGKSSILKTIKYALTGDDSDYDSDIRSWIHCVRLQLWIEEAPFTIHIAKDEAGSAGYIAMGHVARPVDDASTMAGTIETMSGLDEIQDALHKFFFRRLGIQSLSWTQATPTGAEERSTSWRTYFQALVIPDSSDQYLLLDEKHNMGNQEGLILSMFLGLSLVEPLNQLGVETQKAKKETKVGEAEIARVEAEIAPLRQELADAQEGLRRIDVAQRERWAAFESAPDTERLVAVRSELSSRGAERAHLEEQRDALTRTIQHGNSRVRSLEEAIALRLHFTGLDVSLCPNCDAAVDSAALQREAEAHLCRLCAKPAHTASEDEVERMKAEIEALRASIEANTRTRDQMTRLLGRTQREMEALDRDLASMQAVLERGIEYLRPTEVEQVDRSRLEQRIGGLRARIAIASHQVEQYRTTGQDAGLRIEVQERVRRILRQEAEQLNAEVLSHLAQLTEEVANLIGVESITDITCSPLGVLSLRKHDEKVTFKRINNPGERLRVKLAFFLAMIRLGRIEDAGRHPGFLMIDQPGSAEMVEDDFIALAQVMREIDDRHADDLQVICFTARPQFAGATKADKVYGPQVGKYAF